MRQESTNYFDSIMHISLLYFLQRPCGKLAVTKQQLVQMEYHVLFENVTSQMMKEIKDSASSK